VNTGGTKSVLIVNLNSFWEIVNSLGISNFRDPQIVETIGGLSLAVKKLDREQYDTQKLNGGFTVRTMHICE
jgi:hypothetical protein